MSATTAFIAKHWVGLVAIIGGAASFWFQMSYVLDKVNPDTIAEFRVQEARLEAKREIRWCLGKNALRGGSALDALRCADQ